MHPFEPPNPFEPTVEPGNPSRHVEHVFALAEKLGCDLEGVYERGEYADFDAPFDATCGRQREAARADGFDLRGGITQAAAGASWGAALERLGLRHQEGDPDAARTALGVCALAGLAMPPWLATLVQAALLTSDRGEAEDVFGFGSEEQRVRLHKRHLRNRDAAIAQGHQFLRGELGASGVIGHLAKLHGLSPKGLETALRKSKKTKW